MLINLGKFDGHEFLIVFIFIANGFLAIISYEDQDFREFIRELFIFTNFTVFSITLYYIDSSVYLKIFILSIELITAKAKKIILLNHFLAKFDHRKIILETIIVNFQKFSNTVIVFYDLIKEDIKFENLFFFILIILLYLTKFEYFVFKLLTLFFSK